MGMFDNTFDENFKESVRYHFAYSILSRSESATKEEMRDYFGYFYDTDNFWKNTYVYLIRYDLEKKKISIDATHRTNTIKAAIEESFPDCVVSQFTPNVFKVHLNEKPLYWFGISPNNKIFFAEGDSYEFRYLPLFEDLLSLIYSYHDELVLK